MDWHKGASAQPQARLKSQLIKARFNIALERAWPLLWPGLGVVGAFIALSLFDIWAYVPGYLHVLGLAVSAFALLAIAKRFWDEFKWPSHHEVLRRVEKSSGVRHRALSLLEDKIASRHDHNGFVLWEAYRNRLIKGLGRLSAGWPSLSLAQRDPRAFRVLVFVLLLAGLMSAGPQSGERLIASVQPELGGSGNRLTLDVWLTPPEYTGLPPLMVTERHATDNLAVPEGTILKAQIDGGWRTPWAQIGEERVPFKEGADNHYNLETELHAAQGLSIGQAGQVHGEWPLEVVKDQPPIAVFPNIPTPTFNHASRIDYEVYDDFGITELTLNITGPKRLGQTEQSLELLVPKTRGGQGAKAAHYEDFTPSPWAGEEVEMMLSAMDALGQTGQSLPIKFTLPERQFTHPIARILIDIRKELFQRPNARNAPSRYLDAIAQSPEEFDDDLTVYAAMRVAHWRLIHDPQMEAIRQVTDILWDTALRLEEGSLGKTQSQLREAMQELMSALQENSASDISELMNELRQKMSEMLQAQMERMQQEGAPQQSTQGQNTQSISSSQLEQMMQQIEEMAAAGDLEGAMKMLAALQNMMENTRFAGSGMSKSDMQRAQAGQQALQDLENLNEAQRQLMNDTVRQSLTGPNPNGQTPQGQTPGGEQSGESGMNGLARQQRGLGEALNDIEQALGEAGLPTPGSLGEAGEAMNDAAQQLGRGNSIPALRDQGDAMDALRAARDQLGETLEDAMQQMQAQGGMTDPLGRPSNGNVSTEDVAIPSESDFLRTREIRKELERRLSDPNRPTVERQYIRRLLERF
ncbi:MAG: TIGR02302 family protein [Sphingomonadales bacterium]|jgi:uncharacterized protein (TIGR02302 family)